MKTSIVEVADLLSPLSAHGVEKQLMRLPGVKQVEVNPVSGSATVVYDETRIDAVRERMFDGGSRARVVTCPTASSGRIVKRWRDSGWD